MGGVGTGTIHGSRMAKALKLTSGVGLGLQACGKGHERCLLKSGQTLVFEFGYRAICLSLLKLSFKVSGVRQDRPGLH